MVPLSIRWLTGTLGIQGVERREALSLINYIALNGRLKMGKINMRISRGLCEDFEHLYNYCRIWVKVEVYTGGKKEAKIRVLACGGLGEEEFEDKHKKKRIREQKIA